MRLYLSSFRLGNAAEVLPALIGGSGRVAVIANAADAYPDAQRREAVDVEVAAMTRLGLRTDEVDLRDFVGRSDIEDTLRNFDLLWVRGGNPFFLRYLLHRSGADAAIRHLVLSAGV